MIARFLFAGFTAMIAASGVMNAAGPPFELTASQVRLFGLTHGTLVFGEGSIAFRTAAQKDAREWKFADLKQLRILSPTRIQLDTYEEQGRLRLGADRAYTFDVTDPISSELVAFLQGRIDRPFVTAVMPPLPLTPLFRTAVKHAHGRGGSDGALMLYDGGLAYAATRDDDARFWRFQDIFAVLALDPFRLQVLAYERGSGRTRPFTFDLKETLPDGMYDALWQRVNRPNRRPYSVGTDMEERAMNQSMIAGILALGIAAGNGQASMTQDPQHQHGAPAQAADPMAMCRKMMADMSTNTAKLEELASNMNSSSGQAKMTAMSDLLNAMVKERTAMTAAMTDMQPHRAMNDMPMTDEMKAMHAAMSSNPTQPAATSVATPAAFDLAFRMQPEPPRIGEDMALEVTLRSAAGQPVTDAVVTVTFFMSAMPGMGMPEMKNTATLKYDTAGVYKGTSQISMGGRWQVTIAATRAGKEVASKKITITAR